ncbi:unnamed protein product [Gongylonema pulchrum]|uniref:Uncharacterized protein n=1 Tax=Gongylonema pulchrum TaxID=637853 RepID=A0A183ECC7_9BILA|nr:unnamed protein product [Gongylonema pulchrum]
MDWCVRVSWGVYGLVCEDSMMVDAGKIQLSDEIKAAIAMEVRSQIVPLVKEIVSEAAVQLRSILTELIAPIYEDINRIRGNSVAAANVAATTSHAAAQLHTNAAQLQVTAATAAGTLATPVTALAYPSESAAILAEVYAATNHSAATVGGGIGDAACADAATAAAVAVQNAQLQQFLKVCTFLWEIITLAI